ncbi:MAG: hypothetical protein SGILL_006189, partial [Bacillariaceae sp.]
MVPQDKKLRFVQLYTSKSYENRRNMLVRPSEEEENYKAQVNGDEEDDSAPDLKKHALSPTLVDAISKTAQVVWAHTRKSEGLTGRSEMRLQTAVGMPVAVDREGNMCVVVMFSPNNISSTDDAMEYLQSISRSATSTSIPSMLPAFDPKQGLISLPHHHQPTNDVLPMLKTVLSDGVTTRFVSLDENPMENQQLAVPEVHSDHELASAPRDCFGIPMLPAVAELGNSAPKRSEEYGETVTDAFDEASYGVWSTIMQTLEQPGNSMLEQSIPAVAIDAASSAPPSDLSTTSSMALTTISKPYMALERQDRLKEFASAFLDVSVFELAEVWLPLEGGSDALGLMTSVTGSKENASLNDFTNESRKFPIKYWSGAIGRAFSSGNPVWSYNRDVFVDADRLHLFQEAKIETALAVPVFSGKTSSPAFVFCCYSFVRTGSVPFVLKFVQQALKLLWGGLDKVQPHASVGEDLWKDVAPADLGEMAADVEMQQHFIIKKRPIGAISNEPYVHNNVDNDLAAQIETLEGPSETPLAASIYTGRGTSSDYASAGEGSVPSTVQPVQYQTFESVQNHIQDAIRSVGEMQSMHQHVATNAAGSKRAHVFQQQAPPLAFTQSAHQQQQQFFSQAQQQPQQTFVQHVNQQQQPFVPQQQQPQQHYDVPSQQIDQQFSISQLPPVSASAPLAMPRALPNQVVNAQPTQNFEPVTAGDSLQDLLRDPSLLQPTPTYGAAPLPDNEMEPLHLGAIPQPQQQQRQVQPQEQMLQQSGQTLFNNSVAAPAPIAMRQAGAAPNPVISVPFDQLSANGISFAPLPNQAQGNGNGVAQIQPFCVPTNQIATASTGNGK